MCDTVLCFVHCRTLLAKILLHTTPTNYLCKVRSRWVLKCFYFVVHVFYFAKNIYFVSILNRSVFFFFLLLFAFKFNICMCLFWEDLCSMLLQYDISFCYFNYILISEFIFVNCTCIGSHINKTSSELQCSAWLVAGFHFINDNSLFPNLSWFLS